MDSPANRMVVNGYFELQSPVDLARLESALGDGLLKYDRFRQKVVEAPGFFGRPRWVDDADFALHRHLTAETLPSPGDAVALRAAIQARLHLPLDPARPLWEMRLYQGYGAGCALFVRIHHCIADGIALLQVLLDACERIDGAEREAPRSKPKRSWTWWALLPLSATLWVLQYLWLNCWLIVRPKDPPTIYKGPLSGAKRVAWTPPLPLADIKATSAAAGCKINDLLMTAAAGALRRHAEDRGRSLDGKGVRALVPVNLRSAAAAKDLGNKFALVSPTLPVGLPAPGERLRLVKRRMDRLKGNPEPLATVVLLKILGSLSIRLQHRVQRYLVDKTTLVITNVPGPRKRLSLAGVPIERIMFWVPMFGPTGLGLSMFSYGDELSVGVLMDEALVADPQALADAFVLELEELGRTFRGVVPVVASGSPSAQAAA
jgi:hypothetical protein